MDDLTLLWLLRWTILLAGFVLALRWLRGRAVAATYPQCRQCGYNLTGLGDQSTRCPECGALLNSAYAVVRQTRIRKIRPAVAITYAALIGWYGVGTARDRLAEHYSEVRSRPARMMQAILTGNLNGVAALLQKDPKLALRRPNADSPLQLAAMADHLPIAKLLIVNGAAADVNWSASRVPPLHLAAERRNIEMINLLLTHGADIGGLDDEKKTALHHAAAWDTNGYVVKTLLDANADPNALDSSEQTPLHAASRAIRRDGIVVRLLLDAGARIGATDMYGRTPLHWCMRYTLFEGALELIWRGADIGARDKGGQTPGDFAADSEFWLRDLWGEIANQKLAFGKLDELAALLKKEPKAVRYRASYGTLLLMAVEKGSIELTKLLLDLGSDVNAANDDGTMPIHAAARHGDKELLELLVDRGGSINGRDKLGRTPMHVIVDNFDATRKASLLLSLGADPSISDYKGETPLAYASLWRREPFQGDLVDFLIQKGVKRDVYTLIATGDIESLRTLIEREQEVVKDADNIFARTPLHVAVWTGQFEIAKLLLASGAAVNQHERDFNDYRKGLTPLHLAATKGDLAMAKLLLENGADLASRESFGHTPLHLSSTHRNGVTAYLIARGADVNAANRYSETPLHLAAENGNLAGIRLFINAGADPEARDRVQKRPIDRARHRSVEIEAALSAGKTGQ